MKKAKAKATPIPIDKLMLMGFCMDSKELINLIKQLDKKTQKEQDTIINRGFTRAMKRCKLE